MRRRRRWRRQFDADPGRQLGHARAIRACAHVSHADHTRAEPVRSDAECACAEPDTGLDDAGALACANACSGPDADAYSVAGTNSHADTCARAVSFANAGAGAGTHACAVADTHSSSNAGPFADTDASALPDANANARSDAHPGTDACADACGAGGSYWILWRRGVAPVGSGGCDSQRDQLQPDRP